MVKEFESFKTIIGKVGSSLMLIIPANIVKFAGFKKGDKIKASIIKTR